jgi:hypothetical protein
MACSGTALLSLLLFFRILSVMMWYIFEIWGSRGDKGEILLGYNTVYSQVIHHLDDGGSIHLWNVGLFSSISIQILRKYTCNTNCIYSHILHILCVKLTETYEWIVIRGYSYFKGECTLRKFTRMVNSYCYLLHNIHLKYKMADAELIATF